MRELTPRRWWNLRDLACYEHSVRAGARPVAGSERLTPADLALEALMLGLRTTEGIDLTSFRERFGIDLIRVNSALVEQCVDDALFDLATLTLHGTVGAVHVAPLARLG